jgi:predicted enzyme related to lactoylglutathione lyase
VHFELPVTDPERARRFYENVFGWRVSTIPDLDYTTATTGPTHEDGPLLEPGFVNGGLLLRDDATSDATLVVVDVSDILTTLGIVVALGGTRVADRTPVADIGFSASFSDSEGNIVGLWQTASI